MNIPKHPTLIRRLCHARVKKLKATGPVLAASLVIIRKQCGRSGCRCQRGEKHPGHYLTYKEKGKTRTVYVPLDLVEEVKGWIEEHRRLRRLTQEISQLAIAQVRTHVTARNRRAGRS
jgi:hypothetical protein